MTRPRHKFNATPTEVNGRKYASKAEARYAQKLAVLKATGSVIGWLEQVPFHLPGGVKYVCDFQVFDADGTVRFVEVKGMETPVWKVKKKLVEEVYPWVEIEVVK